MKKILCLLTVFLMSAVSFGKTNETAEKRENKVYVIGNGNDFAQVAIIKAVLETENVAFFATTKTEFSDTRDLKFKIDFEDLLFTDTGGEYRQNYFKVENDSNKPYQFYSYTYNPHTYKKVNNKALHYRKSRDAI